MLCARFSLGERMIIQPEIASFQLARSRFAQLLGFKSNILPRYCVLLALNTLSFSECLL